VRAYARPWGRAAVLVCEDAWHTLTGTIAALAGAEVLFVCAAAPARGVWPRDDAVPGPASVARWERLIRDLAEEHGIYACLANLVGSEGGKTFGGTSAVVGPKGDVRARAPMHDETIVVATVDLADIARTRADVPLLSDLRTMLPHLARGLARAVSATERDAPVRYDPAVVHEAPPVVETDAAPGSAAGGTERAGPAEAGGAPGGAAPAEGGGRAATAAAGAASPAARVAGPPPPTS
jgi:hypothetical protein